MLSWLMLPLTQEERELVAEVTHPGGMLSTETAHLILNAEVSHANLQRLQTRATLKDIDKYLDDEIVNRYLNHCLTREDENISSNLSGRKRSHFFSSFFVQRMFDEKNSDPNLRGQYNYMNVKSWSKKVHGKDIFNMKYIFVPIHKDGNHWTLAVIDMEKKCIQYYDSCAGDKNAAKHGSKIMDSLLAYVADEYKYKGSKGGQEMNVSKWELINCSTTASPQQTNGYDCGLFLCMTCKFIFHFE